MAEWLHGRPKSLNVPGSNPAGSAICPQKGLVVHNHKICAGGWNSGDLRYGQSISAAAC